jgi:hypothetical protein
MSISRKSVKAFESIPHIPGSKRGSGDYGLQEAQVPFIFDWSRGQTHAEKRALYISEKIDGSCCAVTKIDGVLVATGRSGYRCADSPHRFIRLFAEWVAHEENAKRLHVLLQEGERATFELCTVAHGTQYMIEGEPLFLLDICKKTNRRYEKWLGISYGDLSNRAEKAGFKLPPLIGLYRFVHPNWTPEQIISAAKNKLKSNRSFVDRISLPEGFVARLEYFDRTDNEFRVLRCKYVFPYFEAGLFMQSDDKVILNRFGLTPFPKGVIPNLDAEKCKEETIPFLS